MLKNYIHGAHVSSWLLSLTLHEGETRIIDSVCCKTMHP